MHTAEDGGEIFAAHGDRLDRLGVVNVFERTGAAGADVFQKVRGVAVAPAAERRDVICELEGGVFLIRLTERRPRGKVLALVLRGKAACGVADLNAGRGAEAEFRVILAQRVHAHAVDRMLGRKEGEDMDLITYVTDRLGHDARYAIDSTKLQRELGWEPSLQFEEGIEKTVRWYLDNQEWLDNVTSGDYQKYYDNMYSKR